MTSVLHVPHYDVEKQAMIEPFTYLEMEISTSNPRSDLSLWVDATGPTLMLGNVAVSGGGGGGITGPVSSTDNAIVRFNGTDGTTIQNSVVTIDDTGFINFPVAITSIVKQDSAVVLFIDKNNKTLALGTNNRTGVGESFNVENIIIGHDTRGSGGSNIILGSYITTKGGRNTFIGNYINVFGPSCSDSIAIGESILSQMGEFLTAGQNVLIGNRVLTSANGNSSNNILIGDNVGSPITTAVNSCIWIGATGVNDEVNSIRIGDIFKTACIINGIYGVSSASTSQKNVKINSDGKIVGTYETRPYFSLYSSISNPIGGLTPLYTFTYTYGTTFVIPMGVTPSNLASSDGLFTPGITTGSIKYVGANTVRVKYTWTISCTITGTVSTIYLLKNGVLVPNTLIAQNQLSNNTNSPNYMVSLATGDVLEIGGQATGTTGTGNINVFHENRYVEIIG